MRFQRKVGKQKSDIYSETSYEYNKRDELSAYTDPEGQRPMPM